MKHILSAVAFFATIQASAQQINPVPDYVFRNQMSVGRNAVTDTAAYFSIGPRYGANKGFMPPIVGDTATFSSGKRNGLLIFSVQKNKFLYWDSVRVQWSDMAGSSGSYITGTLTSSYVPKATSSTVLGNSLIYDNGTNIGIGTTSPANLLELGTNYEAYVGVKNTVYANTFRVGNFQGEGRVQVTGSYPITFMQDNNEWGRFTSTGNFGIGIATPGAKLHVYGDAQIYTIDSITSPINVLTSTVDGKIKKTSLTSLGGVSGSGTTNYLPKFTASTTLGNSQIFDNGTNVGIGTASPVTKFHVSQSNSGNYASVILLSNSADAAADRTGIYGSPSPGAAAPYRGGITFHPGASGALSFHTGNNNSPADGTRMYIQSNGRIGVNTTTDAGYQFDVNGTLRSVNGANFATTSGNVGIGTSSPAQKLDVAGYVISGVTDRTLIGHDGSYSGYSTVGFGGVRNGSNRVFGSSSAADGLYLAAATGRGIMFRVNGTDTDNMVLQSSGELLINTTDAGDYKLQVAGNIYTTGNIQMTGSAAIRNSVSQFLDYGTGGSGDFYIRGGSGFANVLTATNAGNIGIGTTSFGTSAVSVLTIKNGTEPSSSPADQFQLYSKDVTAGNAAAHFRTENGAIIKLYQETTGVGSATFSNLPGTGINNNDTFDGYTIGQIVKALRNIGILQ